MLRRKIETHREIGKTKREREREPVWVSGGETKRERARTHVLSSTEGVVRRAGRLVLVADQQLQSPRVANRGKAATEHREGKLTESDRGHTHTL